MPKQFFICLFLIPLKILSVTVVYNLRIAETTKRQIANQKYRRPSIGAIALVTQSSKLAENIDQSFIGGLATLLYSTPSFYVRADFAAAHVREKINQLRFSRTQTDDILFSAGYSYPLNKRSKVTFSGILGIPTHKDLIPEGIQFGTGHVGTGLQIDNSFLYSSDFKHSIFTAARYIRFFPRKIRFKINNLMIPFDFNIGNAMDLFIAHSSIIRRHRVLFGYNPTFVFGATIKPDLPLFIERTNFIRSNFFASYVCLFLLNKTLPSGIGIGLSYGFDHIPRNIGYKRILTAWTAWGINF